MHSWLTLVLFITIPVCIFANFNDSSEYYVRSGLEKVKQNRIQEAFWDFEKAYNFDKTDTAAISNYAQALYNRRNYFLAREKYLELIDAGSTSLTAFHQLFDLSFNLKKYDDVIKYGQRLKKIKPDEKVMYFIGTAYYNQEDYAQAIPALQAAMKEEPANAQILYTLAHIYLDMQNMKNAMDMFVKAINLKPDYNWMYEAAIAFYESGDAQSSLQYLLMSADYGHPLTSDFKLNLAIAYKNTGHLEQATAKLDELLKKRPTDVDGLTVLARTYYKKKDFDSTIYCLRRVLSVNEFNADAMYMIGVCYLNQGKTDEAEQWISKAAAINPSRNSQHGRPLAGY